MEMANLSTGNLLAKVNECTSLKINRQITETKIHRIFIHVHSLNKLNT